MPEEIKSCQVTEYKSDQAIRARSKRPEKYCPETERRHKNPKGKAGNFPKIFVDGIDAIAIGNGPHAGDFVTCEKGTLSLIYEGIDVHYKRFHNSKNGKCIFLLDPDQYSLEGWQKPMI